MCKLWVLVLPWNIQAEVEVKAEAGVGRSTAVVSKPSEPNQVSPRFSFDEDHKGFEFYFMFEI